VKTIRYDVETLADLFACLNSYLGHSKHANTFTLTRRLFEAYGWLKLYFRYQRGKLHWRYQTPCGFRCLRMQYAYFADRCAQGLLYFQVGCFYEFYGRQAQKAHTLLNMPYIRRKHGFARRCGIGVRALDRYVTLTLQQGVPVTVVNQTGYELGHVAERRIAVKYLLEPTNPSPKPSPAMDRGVAKREKSLYAGGFRTIKN
jgi:RNA-directed DNA polymerase